MSSDNSRKLAVSVRWALAALLVGAFLIRLPGYLYPVTLHYDEQSELASCVCALPPWGTLAHPMLNRYLVDAATFVQCVRTKFVKTHVDQRTSAWLETDPQQFLYLGRIVSMVAGLAAIVAVFALGVSVGGPSVGLVAAAIMAFAPMPYMTSINLRPWSLAILMSTLVLLLVSKVADDRSRPRRWLLLLGASSGVATATVYPLALTVVPVFGALLGRWRKQSADPAARDRMKDLAATATGWLAAHAVCNFHAILQFPRVVRAISEPDASLLSVSGGKLDYWTNVTWHATALFDRFGLGPVIASLGILGLVLAARKGSATWLCMLAYLGGFLLLQPLVVVLMSTRYTAAAVPAIIVGAAWLIVLVGQRIGSPGNIFARIAPTAVLATLAITSNLATCMAYAKALSLPPTRVLARQWIEANIPHESTILQSIKYISPVLVDCETAKLSPVRSPAPDNCYHVLNMEFERFRDSPENMLNYLAEVPAQYFVYTSATPPGTQERLGKTDRHLAAILRRYTPIATFRYRGLDEFSDDTATVNPYVLVFQLR